MAEADDEAAAAEATRLIAASSKLIHPSRTAEIQALVSRAWKQLHVGSTARRSGTADSDTLAPAAQPLAAADTGQSLQLLKRPLPVAFASAAPQPPLDASIARLEEYIVSGR